MKGGRKDRVVDHIRKMRSANDDNSHLHAAAVIDRTDDWELARGESKSASMQPHKCSSCGAKAGKRSRVFAHIRKTQAREMGDVQKSHEGAIPILDLEPSPHFEGGQAADSEEVANQESLEARSDDDSFEELFSCPDHPGDEVHDKEYVVDSPPAPVSGRIAERPSGFEDVVLQQLADIQNTLNVGFGNGVVNADRAAAATEPVGDSQSPDCGTLDQLLNTYTDIIRTSNPSHLMCRCCKSAIVLREGNKWRYTMQSVRRHLAGSAHLKKSALWRKGEEEARETGARNKAAKKHMIRTWLNGLQEGDSTRRMERHATLMTTFGIDMGDVRHGRNLGSYFLECMWDVAASNLKQYIAAPSDCTGRLPVCAFAFDKMTFSRRTALMVGVTFFLNGEMAAFFLEAPLPRNELDGRSLMALLKETIQKYTPISAEGVASLPCDGEMVHHCTKHVESIMGVSGDWLTMPWDQAHCLELRRAQNQPAWLKETTDLVQSTSKTYARGKKFEDCINILNDMEARHKADEEYRRLRWYRPQLFCATRWAAYESIVYKNFLRNFPIIVEDIRIQSVDKTPARKKPTKDALLAAYELEELTNVRFITRVAAMCDLSARVGELSCVLQTVGVMPWCKIAAAQKLADELLEDAKMLRAAATTYLAPAMDKEGVRRVIRPGAKLWPTLWKVWGGLTLTGDENDGPHWLGAPLSSSGGATYGDGLNDVASFMSDFAERLPAKAGVGTHWTTVLARTCFDATSLIRDEPTLQELAAFETLVARSKLYIRLPEPADMSAQYVSLRERIRCAPKDLMDQWYYPKREAASLSDSDFEDDGDADRGSAEAAALRPREVNHQKVFRAIMTESSLYEGAEDVIHLIQTCALKMANESVVESMGSPINKHAKDSLKTHDWVSKEAHLAWCAPPAYTDEAESFISCVAEKLDLDFVRTSAQKSKLKLWENSKVVDRLRGGGRKFSAIHRIQVDDK